MRIKYAANVLVPHIILRDPSCFSLCCYLVQVDPSERLTTFPSSSGAIAHGLRRMIGRRLGGRLATQRAKSSGGGWEGDAHDMSDVDQMEGRRTSDGGGSRRR